MTKDLSVYERTAMMYVEAVRAAADASKDSNDNQPNKADLTFCDPIEYWIKQVNLLFTESSSCPDCLHFRIVPMTSRPILQR